MSKVKIKCIVCNSLDIYKFKIFIYDLENNLECFISFSNFICINLKKGIHRIIITSCFNTMPEIICKNILIEDEYDIFKFYFSDINNVRPVTFRLVDSNCSDLPIEEGKIVLWQNHIQ